MPCDSIILNSLDVGKMAPALLASALTALNAQDVTTGSRGQTFFRLHGVSCRLVNGKLFVPPGQEALADTLKVAYSRQATFYAARKNGWTVKELKPNVFQVIK